MGFRKDPLARGSGGKGRAGGNQHIRAQWGVKTEAEGNRGSPSIEKRCWGPQDQPKGMRRAGWAPSRLLDSPPPFNTQLSHSQLLPGARLWVG